MNRVLVIILSVVICSGCYGYYLASDLRVKSTYRSQFEVESGLQAIIRNLDRKMNEECGGSLYLYNSFIMKIFLIEELGEARIEFRVLESSPRSVTLIDLKRQKNKTKVAMYASGFTGAEDAFRALEHVMKGLPGCLN
jgi:virulence-associated protein VapD